MTRELAGFALVFLVTAGGQCDVYLTIEMQAYISKDSLFNLQGENS